VTAGRRREFDKDEALKAAMLVFWEKGYAGASLADLTTSMGINKPSMYAAFGNKEQLHRHALELYGKQYGEKNLKRLQDESKSLRQRLENFLDAIIRMQFDKTLPTGCLVSACAGEAASGVLSSNTVREIKSMQEHTEDMLIAFFDKARASGELDKNFESRINAVLIGLLIHGSAVMARSGKNIDDIRDAFGLMLDGLKI